MQDYLDPDDAPVLRTGAELPPRDLTRDRALADALGCALTEDVGALGKVKPSTLDAWAKRGEGPPYVMLGNRRLYPIDGLREFLRGRVRTRANSASGLL